MDRSEDLVGRARKHTPKHENTREGCGGPDARYHTRRILAPRDVVAVASIASRALPARRPLRGRRPAVLRPPASTPATSTRLCRERRIRRRRPRGAVVRLDVPPVHVQGGAPSGPCTTSTSTRGTERIGWRAAVRSVRVPPDPAPARSLSSLRRTRTSRRVSRLPRASSASCLPRPTSRVTLARARVNPPSSPADARPRALAPRPSRAGALVAQRDVHLDPSCRLAIFVAITVTMATGWARATCPHSRTRGSPARTPTPRRRLVARASDSDIERRGLPRRSLQPRGAQLRRRIPLFEWTHANPYPRPRARRARRRRRRRSSRAERRFAAPRARRERRRGWDGTIRGLRTTLPPRTRPTERHGSSSPSSSSSLFRGVFSSRARRWARRTRCWRWRTDFYIIFTRPTPRCCRTRAHARSCRRGGRRGRGSSRRVWRWNPPQVGRRTARAAARGRGGRDRSTRGIVGECAGDGAGDARDASVEVASVADVRLSGAPSCV